MINEVKNQANLLENKPLGPVNKRLDKVTSQIQMQAVGEEEPNDVPIFNILDHVFQSDSSS